MRREDQISGADSMKGGRAATWQERKFTSGDSRGGVRERELLVEGKKKSVRGSGMVIKGK